MSPDLASDSLPNDPENCSVFIEVEIGPQNAEGADIFSFTAVTPNWLGVEIGTRWGHGLLILQRFSWHEIESSLQKLLLHCHRSTWQAVCDELRKQLNWEFDNYKE